MPKGMRIQIKIKESFGRLWLYPANADAESMAKLMRRQSFTKDDLKTLQDAGHEVEIVPSYTLDEIMKAENVSSGSPGRPKDKKKK